MRANNYWVYSYGTAKFRDVLLGFISTRTTC
jgi:hypothetical protein